MDSFLDYESIQRKVLKEQYKLSKHQQVRIKAWVSRLSQMDGNPVWRKNRYVYIKILQKMIELGHLFDIFSGMPPQGDIPKILDYQFNQKLKIIQSKISKKNQTQNKLSKNSKLDSKHKKTEKQNRHFNSQVMHVWSKQKFILQNQTQKVKPIHRPTQFAKQIISTQNANNQNNCPSSQLSIIISQKSYSSYQSLLPCQSFNKQVLSNSRGSQMSEINSECMPFPMSHQNRFRELKKSPNGHRLSSKNKPPSLQKRQRQLRKSKQSKQSKFVTSPSKKKDRITPSKQIKQKIIKGNGHDELNQNKDELKQRLSYFKNNRIEKYILKQSESMEIIDSSNQGSKKCLCSLDNQKTNGIKNQCQYNERQFDQAVPIQAYKKSLHKKQSIKSILSSQMLMLMKTANFLHQNQQSLQKVGTDKDQSEKVECQQVLDKIKEVLIEGQRVLTEQDDAKSYLIQNQQSRLKMAKYSGIQKSTKMQDLATRSGSKKRSFIKCTLLE